MFAGKTTEMSRRLVALKQAGMKVLYMNHVGDTRAVEYIFSTHATSIVKGSDDVPAMSIASLPPLAIVEGFDVIAFDEAHWYDDLSVVNDYIDSGLHSTDSLKVLGKLPTLFPHADGVVFLKAYCSVCWDECGTKTDAPFTWRYNPNPDTWVGGAEQYKAVCRAHHLHSLA